MRNQLDEQNYRGMMFLLRVILTLIIVAIISINCIIFFGLARKKDNEFKESTNYKCDTLGVQTNYFKDL